MAGAAAAEHAHHPAPPRIALRHRKSVTKLTPPQLATLRQAFAAVMGIGDSRGYAHHAGIHGLPDQKCQHSNLPHQLTLFLPWHRAYLYLFERALRDQVPGAVLAWWDWTAPEAHQRGIPAAFAAENVDGSPNPLFKASVPPIARRQGQPTETFRQPGGPGELPTRERIQQILNLSDFRDFSSQLQDVHDGVHGWVGGTMGFIAWAAYDPIFWAHHTMIDRIWALWQLRHPQNAFPPEFLSQALEPFPLNVGQTLNIHGLGYDYAASTTHVVLH